MRKTCRIIRNIGAWLSLYYQITLFLMIKLFSLRMKISYKTIKTLPSTSALSALFCKIIANLGILKKIETEPVSHKISDPLMKAVIKCRSHPSIIAIEKNSNSGLSFSFSQVELHKIMKEINNLNPLSANITKSPNTLKQFLCNSSELFECVWPFCWISV